jgi:protein O-GlcNAc transferase
LRRMPGARLILQFKAFADAGTRQRFLQLFAVQGIEAVRIEILGPLEYHERLAVYNRIDLALDPFPYGGTYSSCEALWMGVPIVTLPQDIGASRDTYNFLARLDLADFAASNPSHYVELAVRLAADRGRLASIRGDLRRRMAQSPLCDAPRLAADIGRLLSEAWQRWCRSGNPTPATLNPRSQP